MTIEEKIRKAKNENDENLARKLLRDRENLLEEIKSYSKDTKKVRETLILAAIILMEFYELDDDYNNAPDWMKGSSATDGIIEWIKSKGQEYGINYWTSDWWTIIVSKKCEIFK